MMRRRAGDPRLMSWGLTHAVVEVHTTRLHAKTGDDMHRCHL